MPESGHSALMDLILMKNGYLICSPSRFRSMCSPALIYACSRVVSTEKCAKP